MSKRRSLLTVILTTLLAAVCAFAVACFGATKYNITWNKDENITAITASDGGTLPDRAEEGSKISFKVQCKDGYEAQVSVNDKVSNADKNGVYAFTVNGDVKVDVKSEKVVASIEVTAKPTKLSYVAGEKPDTAGMVVKAKYADGSEGEISDYTLSVTTFSGGETSFKVAYKNHTAEVELDGAVKFTAKLTLGGGELTESAQTALAAMDGYKKEEDVVTFNYYLEEGQTLALPDKDGIIKKDNKLLGWTTGTEYIEAITSENQSVIELTADWQYVIVEISAVRLQNTRQANDTADKPYLVLEGTFYAAESAYLYLKEGKQNVELTGPEVTGKTNEDFVLYFDLTELANAAEKDSKFFGAWMDIRMNTKVGEEVKTQEIILNADSTIEVDANAHITNGNYKYNFTTWTSDAGKTALKVYVEKYNLTYQYEATVAQVGGKPTLTLSGCVKDEWKGGKVKIDWYQSGSDPVQTGDIAADGSWSVSFDLTQFETGKMAYAHITITDAQEKDVLGGSLGETNLLPSLCTNTGDFKAITNAGQVGTGFTINDSEGNAYNLGRATTWDGFVLYAVAAQQ